MTVTIGMIYSAPMDEAYREKGTDAPPVQAWQPFRGPFLRWPRTADTVLALAAFAATMAMWYPDGPEVTAEEKMTFGTLVVFVLGNGALVWRRRQPEVVHAIVIVASALSMALGYLGGPIFALAVSLYSLGRYSDDDQKSYIGAGAAIALLAVSRFVIGTPDSGDGFALLMAFSFWYFGRRVRIRGEYLRVLQERAEQLEREQLAEAEKAVAEERTRIARELHDIVAHQVSLMTVQAGAAKTVADKDPHTAVQAMASVEKAGRQALDELRHLLGVLRPGNEADELGPQPGLADIPRLVEELQQAGLDVSVTLDGTDAELPARVDLSIYRIVQEALTNVLKHAGPQARAEVRISSDDRGVTIEVRDDGRGGTQLPGSGHGIAGMRERAQLLGGSLETRPLPEGGFSVIARLPTSEDF